MSEKDVPSKRKSHRFLILLIGAGLGVTLTLFLPRYLAPYLPRDVSTPSALKGEVTDKLMESDRLVLKVSTGEGILLASFTEMRNDVNLLVENGDSITLEDSRYRPFLEDPTILSVQKSTRGAPRTDEPEETNVKQAYQRKMEAQLEALDKEIKKLEAKAGALSEEAKAEYAEQLEELGRKRDVARQKLGELKRASAAGWEEMKVGVDRAWGELKKALGNAATRFDEESKQ